MGVDLDSLTMHGIGRVLTTGSKRVRAVWSVLVISSIAFAFYFISILVKQYLAYETDLSYTHEVKSAMVFPVVTLCNGLRTYNVENKSTFTDGFEWFSNANPWFCQYNFQNCQNSGLMYEGNPRAKSCLVFNAKEKVQQTSPSVSSGLQVDFFINNSDITVSDLDYYNPRAPAVKVYIHSADFLPTLGSDVVAKLGHLTKLVIRKVHTKRMPQPYKSNCTHDKEKALDYFPGKYSVPGCLFTILQSWMYKYCGYKIGDLEAYFPFERLGVGSVPLNYTCVNEVFNGYNNHEGNSLSMCPLACSEVKYEVTTSSEMVFPLEPQLGDFKKLFSNYTGTNVSDKFIYSSIGRVIIGFEDFTEIRYEEIPKLTVQKVLSEFGGLLGVYLGASFISLFELLSLAIYLFAVFVKNLKKKSQQIIKDSESEISQSINGNRRIVKVMPKIDE